MGGMCEHVNKLGVVLLAVDAFTRAEKECGCGIPCYRVTYEAELSYAHLSKLNVDRISLADDTKRSRVQKMFVEARETFQRVDRYNQNVAFSSFNYRTHTIVVKSVSVIKICQYRSFCRISAENDQTLMKTLLASEQHYEDVLQTSIDVLLTEPIDVKIGPDFQNNFHILDNTSPAFLNDFETIQSIYRAKFDKMTQHFPDMTSYSALSL